MVSARNSYHLVLLTLWGESFAEHLQILIKKIAYRVLK